MPQLPLVLSYKDKRKSESRRQSIQQFLLGHQSKYKKRSRSGNLEYTTT